MTVRWDGGRWWWLRWLTSSTYRRERRLAMEVARELAQDPDHQRLLAEIIKGLESGPVTTCRHPDHLDALFTATACPGCQT